LKLASRDREEMLSLFNAQLRDILIGNSVVISYGTFDTDVAFDNFRYQALLRLLDLLRPARHRVQIVFAIPEGRADLELRLKRNFPGAFVEFSHNETPDIRLDRDESLDYLQMRARDEGLNPDEGLNDFFDQCVADQTCADVDEVFDQWRQQQLVTELFPAYRSIPISSGLVQGADTETAWKELNSLIGLSEVKKHIGDMITRFTMNRNLARLGLPVQSVSMHAVFLGPPGTGKTEVARLYARILKEEGFLSEGRLINLSGNSGFDVKAVFDAARGSVIFIDEAYALTAGVITDLIAYMENRRADTVVILAGYEDAMNRTLDINPGFRSRLGVTLKFPSYSESELFDIFMLLAQRAKLTVGEEAQSVVRDVLARGGRREDQGNARFVRKLFEDTIGHQQVRLAHTHQIAELTMNQLLTLLPEDIEPELSFDHAENSVDAQEASQPTGRDELQHLIGLTDVKKLVSDQLDFFRIQKERRNRKLPTAWMPMHMAFKGNPGTGKTEVARIVGRILREEKVLSIGDVYEVGRQDLVARYVGHTAPKVHDLFRKAKGSVIFIDEAYSLVQGPKDSFGHEAVTTLIDDMEKFRDEVVVILAGYTDEINQLLDSNPGFKSRVKFHVDFPDYSIPELIKILKYMVKSRSLVLADDVETKVESILYNVPTGGDSGNARFVRNLLEDAMVRQATRLIREAKLEELDDEDFRILRAEDFTEPQHAPQKRLPVGFSI
ncbi:MAG: AAA family ATPase, partial [Actinomycetaceae bacterium]|nr:AAA family ATPase [Actinomycetaceae bacterium]